MKTKNPIGQESGFSYDAFTNDIKDSSNLIIEYSSCKLCGNKAPPHAHEVDNRDPITHIYVGDDALLRCVEAYYNTPVNFPVAAMALPPSRSPFEFTWPVENRRVVILSAGECSEIVYELGHALIACNALEVFGAINDVSVRWKQPIERRFAT